MNCIAHLSNRNGKRVEQSLKEHCSQVAKYAGECLKDIGLYHVAYLSGMLHDMGKATKVFNEYIESAFQGGKVVKGSVIHSYTGAIYILERYHNGERNNYEKLTSEIIGYVIGAHHGLFDCVNLNGVNGFEKRLSIDKAEIYYNEAIENFFSGVQKENEIEEHFIRAVDEIKLFCQKCTKSICVGKKERNQVIDFQIGLLARLVTSAVIYGDRRDTREFMQGRVEEQKVYVGKNLWKETADAFEQKIGQFSAETELNKVRQKISNQCFDFAKRETGIYRLNVPTGAGKTLSTLRYALEHAKEFDKRRIIYIIPLLSVIDQNAKVLREYLENDDMILEHHSNVINEKVNDSKSEEDGEELDCLQEDWNHSPIVISTLVQLLEILFSHKTSTISRMQALSDSIIVFDEIQSLPKKVTEMFNIAMNFLKTHCNTTIILSSATQPCLETIEWPIELADNPDMVKLSETELAVFDRAEIIDGVTPYGMTDDELEEFCEELISENRTLLVICNTREEARNLFCRLSDKENESREIYHLSTSMCQKHRVNELTDIQEELHAVQENLKESKSVICVATQLVEAGIDFSFQCVVRILAGLDNLTQAAGRCNRSNEYPQKGKVYFVNLRNERLDKLKEIKVAQDSATAVLSNKDLLEDGNLIGGQAINSFYRGVFANLKEEIRYPISETKYPLSRLLGNAGQEKVKYILKQPFKTVARKFKVFDNETVDVIVPYNNGIDIIQRLRNLEDYKEEIWELKEIIREAKPYTINVYNHQIKKLSEYGWLEEFFDGKIFALNEEMYSEKYGLKQIVQQSVENYFF